MASSAPLGKRGDTAVTSPLDGDTRRAARSRDRGSARLGSRRRYPGPSLRTCRSHDHRAMRVPARGIVPADLDRPDRAIRRIVNT